MGHWLCQEVPGEQAHLRVKTGYFTMNGLGALKASIDHLVQNDLPISIALGANEKATIKADVDALYTFMGCPRPNAKLCVVRCTGGLFHPKVVHLTRTDGSELAYVGSANVTPAGVNGTNIEAGLLLDSRQGDPIAVLKQIAASVDQWFAST
ncbi:MAG TPA: phospholipase D family protein, partial [Croceibacterium sp.]